MSTTRYLLVTHHAPDLDAVTSVWLLKRFDAQKYGSAKVAFVNPGSQLSPEEAAEQFQCGADHITHVDTGLGTFDHHQPERASDQICASSLILDYLCEKYPDLKDDQALRAMVDHVLAIDHFKEISWPEAKENRFMFSLHELIHGHEFTQPHDDDSQLHFGMEALDYAYAAMIQNLKAKEIIQSKGQEFALPQGLALAVETRNDETLKTGQLMGYVLVVRKDPEFGHIRIKVRPDVDLSLQALYEKLQKLDPKATWYYHPSGKMLLNGSIKHRQQIASALTLEQVIQLIQTTYQN
jgi:hypothetical protein